MIKINKKNKNPKIGNYFKDLIGKKVVLLTNNGYIEEKLQYNKTSEKYFLMKLNEDGSASAYFYFFEKNIKDVNMDSGIAYIDIKTD